MKNFDFDNFHFLKEYFTFALNFSNQLCPNLLFLCSLILSEPLANLLSLIEERKKNGSKWFLVVHSKLICEMDDRRLVPACIFVLFNMSLYMRSWRTYFFSFCF